MKSRKTYLYVLIDPTTAKIRYIGISVNPKKRLSQHLHEAKSGVNSEKCKWIRALPSPPIMVILDEGEPDFIAELEIRFIRTHRKLYGKESLFNLGDGGEGKTVTATEETVLLGNSLLEDLFIMYRGGYPWWAYLFRVLHSLLWGWRRTVNQ